MALEGLPLALSQPALPCAPLLVGPLAHPLGPGRCPAAGRWAQSVQRGMPLSHLTLREEPEAGNKRGGSLLTDQSSGSSVDMAVPCTLSRAPTPCPEAEGRVARTRLRKVLLEWRLLLVTHVGEGQPGKKWPAPCCVTCQTSQALPSCHRLMCAC